MGKPPFTVKNEMIIYEHSSQHHPQCQNTIYELRKYYEG